MKLVSVILFAVVFGAFQAGAQIIQQVTVLSGNGTCPIPVEQEYTNTLNNRVMTLYCHNFQSQNFQGHYIGVAGGDRNRIVETTSNQVHQWHLVPGWTGQPGTVSFQSCSDNRRYIRARRAQNNEVYADIVDDTDPMSMKEEATFYWRRNMWFDGFDAFESAAAGNNFVRHAGFVLHLHGFQNTDLYRADASFRALPDRLF